MSNLSRPTIPLARSILLRSSVVPASHSPCLTIALLHHRPLSSTPPRRFKEVFPEKESPQIRKTLPAWKHPVYTREQMNAVEIAHREAKTWSDWVAYSTIRVLRSGMDSATGYRHDKAVALGAKDPQAAKKKYAMTARKYLIRNIFLESVAGVPGMVFGMLRHLRSMRRMERDNGWIETLLEESYNERMHLLTFMKMAEPGLFMKLMVLGAQGVFFNFMFVSYLVSPRTAHRMIGYLEEEAVVTYTQEIADLDAGLLPEWENKMAPQIAIDYWNMPEGNRTIRDLLLYIRADEAKHREVGHSLGNLQADDPNPFTSTYKAEAAAEAAAQDRPLPSKGLENLRSTGWERHEVI